MGCSVHIRLYADNALSFVIIQKLPTWFVVCITSLYTDNALSFVMLQKLHVFLYQRGIACVSQLLLYIMNVGDINPLRYLGLLAYAFKLNLLLHICSYYNTTKIFEIKPNNPSAFKISFDVFWCYIIV